MSVHGRRSGVGRARAGLGLVVVAVMWALSFVSPGVAGASPVASRSDRVEPTSTGAEVSVSQAPPGLRSAVQRSLGAEARPVAALKQQAELTASDAAQLDIFGLSVAVSGSTALVGAPEHNVGTGAAYVFVRSGTKWSQQAELTASDGASGDEFGWSVAVSGSTAVVGSFNHNVATGAAYVFVRSGTKWSQQAELTAANGASGDQFGWSAAVSGSTAVVGALGHNSSTGAAYVFVRSGTKWSQQAKLSASDGGKGDQFGWSVAVSVTVSGSTAVIGAPFHNSSVGKAYVFVRSGAKWSRQAGLTAANAASRDEFGLFVAVSGSTAVIGAPFHPGSPGKAYVFVRSGTKWSQQAELTPSDGASGDTFGRSVAVSGSTAVVGAPDHNTDTGAAYVFGLPSTRG